MPRTVTIEVEGPPVAKARARVTRRGAYTPARTREYEGQVALAARLAMGGHAPFNGPLFTMVEVHLPVPRSWSKKKQAAALAGDLRPTSRPDLDNVVKAALDGCAGVVFFNDSQVIECAAVKSYRHTPKLVITVTPWLGAPAMGEVAE